MAYIVSTTKTATASAASYTVTLGAHVSGDLLLVKVSQDGGGTTIAPDATSATAGWAMLGTQAASGASRSAWAWLIADSASEVNPVFTGATDDWIGTCLVIRDAHATAPFGATPASGTDFVRTDWATVGSSDSGALTTAVDGCLLLYSWNADGNLQYMRTGWTQACEVDKYATASISHIIALRQQQSAAAAPTVTMYNINATEGGNGWVIAVRNKASGALQPDVRLSGSELKFYGPWSATHDSVTWQAPDQFAASINSITCASTSPTVASTSFWSDETYGQYTQVSTSNSVASEWAGGTHAITSTDMTGMFFSIQLSMQTASSSAVQGADGVLIGFSDGTNWVTYQILTKEKGWAAGVMDRYAIALGQSTEYANSDGDSSSSIDWGAVTRIGYFFHRAGSVTNAHGPQIKNATLISSIALTGGGSSRPATFQDIDPYINGFSHWKHVLLQASSQLVSKYSVQIGDGTNSTYFDGAAQSFEFPQAWSASSIRNWQMFWNAAANSVGLSVKAKSGDTINLASGVAATDTAQNLSINASTAATGDATYSFAQSFVGWRDPIDNKGLGWSGATFKKCGTVTIAGGGDLTNCTIAKTTSTHAPLTITANGTVVTTSTITVADTSITTAHHISFGASVTSCTLNGVTLSGAAGTDKIYSALASGTLTITVDGTGTALVAGDVTFVGGSTAVAVIAAPALYQKVTVSGITTGARVQIYDTTSSTELFNGTATAGDTVVTGSTVVWTDPVAAAANRAIRVRVSYVSGATAKNFIETSGLTCGQTAGTAEITYPVSPTDDTVYNANGITGSGVTGVTFTDAATDVVNINVVANAISWKTIYAAWVYYVFGSTGIASDIDYIDAVDEANYILSNMIIKNTSSPTAPLEVTGGYGRDSVTGATIDLADTTGGTLIFAPDHVVSYAVGSGVTAQDITDIAAASGTAAATATLAAAQTTPIHSDVRKVVGITVDGTGTDGDPWGPQ